MTIVRSAHIAAGTSLWETGRKTSLRNTISVLQVPTCQAVQPQQHHRRRAACGSECTTSCPEISLLPLHPLPLCVVCTRCLQRIGNDAGMLGSDDMLIAVRLELNQQALKLVDPRTSSTWERQLQRQTVEAVDPRTSWMRERLHQQQAVDPVDPRTSWTWDLRRQLEARHLIAVLAVHVWLPDML